MNRAQTEYAALRYTSAKLVSSITMDIKAGNVLVETIEYDRLGKRIRKFRCPPGTRRAGKWTNSMGTTCNLGPARATLAKLGERIEQFDAALEASEKRRETGGPGLVRFQAGRALERGGQILDFLDERAQERRSERQERRQERRFERRRKLGSVLERAGELLDNAIAGEDISRGNDGDKDKTPDIGLTAGDLPTPKKVKKKKTTKKPDGSSSSTSPKPEKKPTGPAAAAEANIDNAANVNQVNAGKAGKKKPGKQVGNLFSNEHNAKGKASQSAQDNGETLYVVKTSTGKFRIVDEERFLAGDEPAAYVVGPDGVVHDFTGSEDLSPAEIVDDINVQNAIDAIVAEAEAHELPILSDKSLEKSKTGKFLPDELNEHMVEELGDGKTKEFLDAFQEQRERNLNYWMKRLGDDAPDTDNPDEFLAAIDKLIEEEKNKTALVKAQGPPEGVVSPIGGTWTPTVEQGGTDLALLGQMTAERKNFLAMWVPDQGEEDVDPFKRLNYVQPKRRHDIIEGAGLEDLIIGKSKTKSTPKTKLALEGEDKKIDLPQSMTIPTEPEPLHPNVLATYDDEKYARKYAEVFSGNGGPPVVLMKRADGPWMIMKFDDFDIPFATLDPNEKVTYFFDGEGVKHFNWHAEKGTFSIDDIVGSVADAATDETPWQPGENWLLVEPDSMLGHAHDLSDITQAPVHVVHLKESDQWFLAPDSEFDPVALAKSGESPDWPVKSYKGGKEWATTSVEDAGDGEFTVNFTPWTSAAGFGEDEPNVFSSWADAEASAGVKSLDGPDLVLFRYSGNSTVDMMPHDEFLSSVAATSIDWEAPPVLFQEGGAVGYFDPGMNMGGKYLNEYPNGVQPDFEKYGTFGYTPPMSQQEADWYADSFVTSLTNDYSYYSYSIDDGWAVEDDFPDGVSTADLEQYEKWIAEAEAARDKEVIAYAEALRGGLDEYQKESFEYNIAEAHSVLVDLESKHYALSEAHANGVVNDVVDDPLDDDIVTPDLPDTPEPDHQAKYDAVKELPEWEAFKKSKDKGVKASTTKANKPPASITTQEELDAWHAEKVAAVEAVAANWKQVYEDDPSSPTMNQVYYIEHYADAAKVSLDKQKKIHEKKLKAQADAQAAIADVVEDGNVLPADVSLPSVEPVIEADLDAMTGGKAATGIDVLFDLPDYDHSKLYSAENGKMVSLATAKARYDKYGAEVGDLLSQLPDNFHQLSADERLQALMAASPSDDQLTAAKRLARSIVANQFGDKASLEELEQALADIASGTASGAKTTNLDERIATLTKALDDAEADLAALGSDAHEVTKLYYEGRAATARNKLIAAQMYKQTFDSNGDLETLSSNGKALAANVDSLPAAIRSDAQKTITGGIDIKPGSPKTKASKTLLSTDGFDSTNLGTVQPDGSAVAYSIPIGHKGLYTQTDANDHIASGKPLSEVPDDYLKEAIWANTGPGKRFAVIKDGSVHQGWNSNGQAEKDKTTGFLDTVTGKKYVIKSAHRNDQEHTQEIAGALVQQSLGMNAVGIRVGSPLQAVPFEAGPASKYGKAAGDQRAMVLEHVSNLFPDAEAVYTSFHDIPAGSEIDPESLARLIVMDRVFNYFDRTGPNLVAVKRSDGKIHLQPIDHGNAFQDWDGSGTEQAAGFTKVTKSDNIDLFSLAKNMSDEDKEVFARAMSDAVRRYKKTDHTAVFQKAAATQKMSPVEAERMAKHAAWLEARKESLDWDKMTVSAVSQLGFDDAKVTELLSSPNAGAVVEGFGLPSTAHTIGNISAKIDEMPKKGAFTVLNYDSDQIENFDVRVQPLRFKYLDSDATKFTAGTQLTFKRRGEAAELVPSEADGWKKLPTVGQPSPKWGSSGTATLNFSAFDVSPGTNGKHGNSSNGTPVQTWYRELDDGTIVTVTLAQSAPSQHYMSASSQSVRIVIPGNSSDVTPDRVAKAMEAVGVMKHDAPSDDDVRSLGLRSALSLMEGKPPEGLDIDEVSTRLADKYGLGEDAFRTRTYPNGRVSVELTPTAAKALMEKTDKRTFVHNLASSSDETLLSILTQGEILSTLRRHEHAVRGTGMSSHQDMNKTGGGDWVYTHKRTDDPLDITTAGTFVIPALAGLRRTDLHAYSGDAWGNPSKYEPFESGMTTSFNEVDFRGGVDLSSGILIVSESSYDSLIQAAKDRGRTEVGGIPIEDIVATPSTAKQKMQALLDRLNEEL